MPVLFVSQLTDRGIVRIAGADADKLLEKLITNSLEHLAPRMAIYSGLLSPQGKIMFDFFLIRAGSDLLIDVAQASLGDLIKRLTLYKLRADVSFEDMSGTWMVAAAWGKDAQSFPGGVIAFQDPRAAELGLRLILPHERLPELAGTHASEDDYHAHRICVGVPEAGRDFELGDTFPHEALYDQLYGVDFKKGCFVGQEVVSRMQHRGSARKRIVPVKADRDLVSGTEITVGTASIGTLGSVAGNRGLALMRLDRAHEATLSGTPIQAGAATIAIDQPHWLKVDMATGRSLDGMA
ncbi:MAG: folate-binding protein [Pseudomonadota bacterium]